MPPTLQRAADIGFYNAAVELLQLSTPSQLSQTAAATAAAVALSICALRSADVEQRLQRRTAVLVQAQNFCASSTTYLLAAARATALLLSTPQVGLAAQAFADVCVAQAAQGAAPAELSMVALLQAAGDALNDAETALALLDAQHNACSACLVCEKIFVGGSGADY